MRKVTVVKSPEVEIKPFIVNDFISLKESHSPIEKVSKKELKILADELGLSADKSHLLFAKKLLNAYMKRIR